MPQFLPRFTTAEAQRINNTTLALPYTGGFWGNRCFHAILIIHQSLHSAGLGWKRSNLSAVVFIIFSSLSCCALKNASFAGIDAFFSHLWEQNYKRLVRHCYLEAHMLYVAIKYSFLRIFCVFTNWSCLQKTRIKPKY